MCRGVLTDYVNTHYVIANNKHEIIYAKKTFRMQTFITRTINFVLKKSQSGRICQWQLSKLINIKQHYVVIHYIHTTRIYKFMCICMNIIMCMIIIVYYYIYTLYIY